MALFQLAVAALVAAPFYPFMGSPAFLLGYVRPVRFWERKYKTNRLTDADVRTHSAFEHNGGGPCSAAVNADCIIFYTASDRVSDTPYVSPAKTWDRGRAATTANNVDAIFYEHLEQALSRTLYDEIAKGRWGVVEAGDMYILISEKVCAARRARVRWWGRGR